MEDYKKFTKDELIDMVKKLKLENNDLDNQIDDLREENDSFDDRLSDYEEKYCNGITNINNLI